MLFKPVIANRLFIAALPLVVNQRIGGNQRDFGVPQAE